MAKPCGHPPGRALVGLYQVRKWDQIVSGLQACPPPLLVCPGPYSEALSLLVVSTAAQLLPEKNLRQSLLPKLTRHPLPSGQAGNVFPITRVTLELKWGLQEPHRLTDFDHAND